MKLTAQLRLLWIEGRLAGIEQNLEDRREHGGSLLDAADRCEELYDSITKKTATSRERIEFRHLSRMVAEDLPLIRSIAVRLTERQQELEAKRRELRMLIGTFSR